MSVEYRHDRKCWTFRVFRSGKRHKGYGFATEREAHEAEKKLLKELDNRPKLTPTSLQSVATQFVALAQERRSERRAKDLCAGLANEIIPFFGPQTLVTAIEPERVEEFMYYQLKRVGRYKKIITPMTVWHLIKDLRATLNFAIRKSLLDRNPVGQADLSPLSRRKVPKCPLNLADFDDAANCLTGNQRLWFDLHRFLGLRKGEGNRLQVKHLHTINNNLWLLIPGTKTVESERVLPVPPVLWEGFKSCTKGLGADDFIFGRTAKWSRHAGAPAGGPIMVHDRRAMFKRIKDETGFKIKPKDLRDYFASIMKDATVASKMLGHTGLTTTSIYTRQVQERMLEAVELLGAKASSQSKQVNLPETSVAGLGASFGGQSGQPDSAKPCVSVHHGNGTTESSD